MPEKSPPVYEVTPLRSDVTRAGVVQSRNKTVNPKDPKPGMKENLEHMLWLIDEAQGWGFRKDRMLDLLVFHEFPFAGWNTRNARQDNLNVAIEVPGPETEAVCQKAKQYNCYIAFGSYTKDKDWPGHFFNTGMIAAPNGMVILKNYKRRNTVGSGFATAVYDVLDRFIELYGWDAVFPVARTDIGNIAFAPCIFEPEIVRALAMKGAEIVIRYMTSGGPYRFDLPALCATNQIYGIFVNQSVYDGDVRREDERAGGTAIFDETGKTVAEASSHHETLVSANIPIASFRKRHALPVIRKEMFEPLWNSYIDKYPPNSFLKSLPNNNVESIEHYRSIARW
ncbi:MAG: nitrilase-related carbon-nitrogen hydrolase [Chloroflexota bacterium]